MKIEYKSMSIGVTLGVIGVLFTFLLLLCIFRFINQEFLFVMNKVEGQVFLATVFLIIGGLIDDIAGMNAPKKLFFQIISILTLTKKSKRG